MTGAPRDLVRELENERTANGALRVELAVTKARLTAQVSACASLLTSLGQVQMERLREVSELAAALEAERAAIAELRRDVEELKRRRSLE